MATKMSKISVFVLVVAVLCCKARAQTQTGCTRTLMALSPCLNYVTGNTTTPTGSCCSQLSNVVSSQPQCLCLLLNGTASSYGFNINQTLALGLPAACSVQTPPTSRCNANAPSASPDTQQSPPADSSEQPAGSIPSGSKTVPSVNGGSNMKTMKDNIVVFLLITASFAALSVAGL